MSFHLLSRAKSPPHPKVDQNVENINTGENINTITLNNINRMNDEWLKRFYRE